MKIPRHFKLSQKPLANPQACVTRGNIRFTVLTPRLIRLEYSPAGVFEDHASQAFWYRDQPVPKFTVSEEGNQLRIETQDLLLTCDLSTQGFQAGNPSIQLRASGITWHFGDSFWYSGQLYGTARTLDEANGRIRLEPGLMSRQGWALVDDSKSVVFNETGWVQPRKQPQNADLYFFGYGKDFLGCLKDFTAVAGPIPMIPRYILGNWWSRYWAFTQAELQALMEDFQRHEVPLSICIIDMDWHLAGWTGYTWNRQLWPDPEGFIRWLHKQGLRTALNLHPSDGVGTHEAQYEDMARAIGQDPAENKRVAFDIANPVFTKAYFDLLHHPYEKMGVDFWWLDWQQERVTRMPNLDPLYWLNHLHYQDLGRNGRKRPFIFSRWGGLGNHRYPIGFSGDTEITWESLAFQPYFTATASNVAYGWWSHDIGGHMFGVEDDELYARWVQFGVFSPILRLHSTNNPYHDRRPWGRALAYERVASDAMRLRHRLIPYIYSMAWRAWSQSIPLITPLYYWHAEEEAAYQARDQYYYGSELLAAPITNPLDPQTGFASRSIWLPEGQWFHLFNNRVYQGGRWIRYQANQEDIPVFAKTGAILPSDGGPVRNGTALPETLQVDIFPGQSNRFSLYEDDGETVDYLSGKGGLTQFTSYFSADEICLKIEPPVNGKEFLPRKRRFVLRFRAIPLPKSVKAGDLEINQAYDSDLRICTVSFTLPAGQGAEIVLSGKAFDTQPDWRPQAIREMLRSMKINTGLKLDLDLAIPDLLQGKRSLNAFEGLSDAQAAALTSILEA